MTDYSSLNDETLQTLINARKISVSGKGRDNMVAALVGYDTENDLVGGMSIADLLLFGKLKKTKSKQEGEPPKIKSKRPVKGKGKSKAKARGKGKKPAAAAAAKVEEKNTQLLALPVPSK